MALLLGVLGAGSARARRGNDHGDVLIIDGWVVPKRLLAPRERGS